MWKRDEEQPFRPTPAMMPVAASVANPEPMRVASARSGAATIGPSIVVKGELSGDEDLFIHGQVDGSVALGLHAVTVGNVGRVKANITGRVITIEGAVEGNLRAQEQIILRGSAKVQGDLKAPRIVLEDGATFRGLIDMGSHEGSIPPEAKAAVKVQGPVAEKPGAATTAKPDAGAAREATRGGAPPPSKGRDPSHTGTGG